VAGRKETSKHLEAFDVWCESGRNFTFTSQKCTVSRRALYDWADAFNWHERADARDAEVRRLADEQATRDRAERQKRRRRAAELLTARGVEFFKKNKIDSPRDAIQAIKYGTEIERKEDGVPDWVMLILNANPEDLEAMAKFFGVPVAGADSAGEDDDSVSLEPDAENED
jgi:hypothetical protein